MEVPLHLAFGWIIFLQRNLGEMTFSIGRISSGVIGVVLAMGGLHLLAGGWRRAIAPTTPAWSWRWSAAITLVIVAMMVAALSVAGMAHQIAWLKSEPKMETDDGPSYRKLRKKLDAGNLVLLFSDFREEHGGRFPENVSDMVAWHMADGTLSNDMSNFVFFPTNPHSTPESWLYFGRGLTRDIPDETILLADPRPDEGLRMVVTADGEINELTEEVFQNTISRQERQ